VDANGILNVKAKDKTSGKEQSIRIEASSGLSKEEIEKMQKDAELHADEDKKNKEMVEVKNVAEQTIYTAEKSLKDNGDKISAELKASIEAKITALKTAKDGTDHDALKAATEALGSELSKMGEEMSKAQAQAGAEASQPKDTTSEPVKDAEVKEEPKA
jgi:molecular chaperone DnaK